MQDRFNRAVAPGEAFALVLARICLAAIFLPSAVGKLTGLEGFSGYLTAHGVPAEYGLPAAIAAATIEAVGALCILVGFMTRIAALVMALFAVIAAGVGHRFWEITDPTLHSDQMIQFMKNVAIAGGFLALYAAGPGRASIDRRGD